jgi:hypothetical protein
MLTLAMVVHYRTTRIDFFPGHRWIGVTIVAVGCAVALAAATFGIMMLIKDVRRKRP